MRCCSFVTVIAWWSFVKKNVKKFMNQGDGNLVCNQVRDWQLLKGLLRDNTRNL